MKKLVNNLISSFLILCLAMGYLFSCLQTVVSAVDVNEENKAVSLLDGKILFDAFFKENESKSYAKQDLVKNGGTVFVSIKLNESGILNGAKIVFNDANFVIDKTKLNSENVKNVSENEISLNTILYGQEVVLEIPFLFNDSNKADFSYYDKELSVQLSGSYQDDNNQTVQGSVSLNHSWTDDADVSLSQEIDKIYSWDNGTIVENYVKTDVQNSVLPREVEVLELAVPDIDTVLPDSVKVILNGKRLADDFVSFDSNAKKVVINLVREVKDSEEIEWKNGINEYKIVFEYNRPLKLDGRSLEFEVVSKTKLLTKDEIKKDANVNQALIAKGNVVTVNSQTTAEIFKGYLYANSNIETNYNETIDLGISSANAVDNLELLLGSERFLNDNERSFQDNGMIAYKNTKINYDDLFDVLGEQGNLIVKDANENVIQSITKDTPKNENGYIIINYSNLSDIHLVFSKPEKEGTVRIENEKVILGNESYSKEDLKKFTKLQNDVVLNTNVRQTVSNKISLLDTQYGIDFQISNKNYTTIQKNEDINLIAILNKNSNRYELFENPVLEFVFPSDFSQVDVHNVSLLYDDELVIQNYELVNNNEGQIVLKVYLQGKQTKYDISGINQGTNVVINADFTLKNTAETSEHPVTLNVYNGDSVVSKDVDVSYTAPSGMVSVDEVTNFNSTGEVAESIMGGAINGKLETKKSAGVATIHSTVMNYNSEEVQNVSVLGRLPVKDNSNLSDGNTLQTNIDLSLLNGISVNGVDSAQVYYSTNGNANNDLQNAENGWTTNSENAKSYLISVPNMQKNQKMDITYQVQIPENLEYNQQAVAVYKVDYARQNVAESYSVQPVTLSTGEGPNMDVEISLPDQEYHERELRSISVVVTNTGKEDIRNATLKVVLPDGVKYAIRNTDEDDEDNNIKGIIESDEKELVSVIQDLPVGEKYEISYEFVVQRLESGSDSAEIEFNAYATVENYEDVFEAISVSKPVKKAELEIWKDASYTADTVIEENTMLIYGIDVKNITDSVLNNVVIEDVLQDELKFTNAVMSKPGSATEVIENGTYDENTRTISWKIDSIEPNQNLHLIAYTKVEGLKEDKIISNRAKVITETGNEYLSNIFSNQASVPHIEITKDASVPNNEYIKEMEEFEYYIHIKNTGSENVSVSLEDIVPEGIMVKGYSYKIGDGEETSLETGNHNIHINELLKPNNVMDVTIRVQAYLLDDDVDELKITNKATVTANVFSEFESNEITHIIEKDPALHPEEPDNPDNPDPDEPDNPDPEEPDNPNPDEPDNPGNPDEPDNPDNPNPDEPDNPSIEKIYKITGEVWLDQDKNGQKDDYESGVPDVNVYLLNTDTNEYVEDENGNLILNTTATDGSYRFENLSKGNYIVVFVYNTDDYGVTTYQKEGVSVDKNSDAIEREIDFNGVIQLRAVTDTISITDRSRASIDLGLTNRDQFDLSLDKNISQIVVTTGKTTQVYSGNGQKLNKIEIDRKKINGAVVRIDYAITIKNEGDVPGYAREIYDYLPSDFNFNEKQNIGWKLEDNKLINTSLQNVVIEPNSSQTIHLILTKNMDNDSTGTFINVAEIGDDYNEKGLEDYNSTVGNKQQGENDMSDVTLIIGVKTGRVVTYIGLGIVCIALLGVGIYIIRKKVL